MFSSTEVYITGPVLLTHLDDFWDYLLSSTTSPKNKNSVASGLFPWFYSLLSSCLTHQLQKCLAAAPLGTVISPCSCSSSLLWGNHFQGTDWEANRLGGSVPFLLFIAVLITLFIFPYVVFIMLVHEFLSSSILFELSQNASLNNSMYWLSLSYKNNCQNSMTAITPSC